MANTATMAKIIVLGSSAVFPFPRTKTNLFGDYLDTVGYLKNFELHDDPICQSAKRGGKDRRTRASMALIYKNKTILFNAGPDVLYQLGKFKLKPDAVFINHDHLDASCGVKFFNGASIFGEALGNVRPGRKIKIFGAEILPFRVKHAKDVPTVGYLIVVSGKKVVYISDLSSVAGIKKYVVGCDILFADGSILNRNLTTHISIVDQLKFYKKLSLKKVIFTHIGHATLPHRDLVKYVKNQYKNANIAYDGMTIKL